jgi:beta-galactosidase/beta-glucuronidase
MKHISYYKREYPRPQLYRDRYMLLNGRWDFAFGDDVKDEEMIGGFRDKLEINVPFTYQAALSGIGSEQRHDTVWYSRSIMIDEEQLLGRVILHLEGCDYETFVFANGVLVGSDRGGYHRLSFDCTDSLKVGENNITLKVCDDYSVEKPRGKQRAKDQNYGCWYTDTTGIYKTAWLEFVPKTYLGGVLIEPDVRAGAVSLDCRIEGEATALTLEAKITYEGREIANAKSGALDGGAILSISLTENEPLHLWSLDDPSLYEVEITVLDNGEVLDRAYSYFGARTIEARDGRIYLNDKELYQKLALDQGYWRDGLLTAPSEEALVQDIIDMADMGFNGVRKHQKVEDERYLYYADIMGFIVWAEMPSMYSNTEKSRTVFEREWFLAVDQQRNHPSVLTWVPFNESWGIEEIKTDKVVQDFVNDIYYKTHKVDKTRPVITNDGWEHTVSDILTIHHYEQDGKKLHSYYDTIEKCCKELWESHHKGAFADGYGYRGQPIIISEFGGTAFVSDTTGENWGYGIGVNNIDEFYARFESLIEAIDSLPYSCGYCYTQVTDVQQEVNGLLDFDHKSKFDKDTMKKILNKSGR